MLRHLYVITLSAYKSLLSFLQRIDFVAVEDDVITVVGQVKYRNSGYININDIPTFLSKCKKKLIIKGCKISKKLRKQLHDIEIEIL